MFKLHDTEFTFLNFMSNISVILRAISYEGKGTYHGQCTITEFFTTYHLLTYLATYLYW